MPLRRGKSRVWSAAEPTVWRTLIARYHHDHPEAASRALTSDGSGHEGRRRHALSTETMEGGRRVRGHSADACRWGTLGMGETTQLARLITEGWRRGGEGGGLEGAAAAADHTSNTLLSGDRKRKRSRGVRCCRDFWRVGFDTGFFSCKVPRRNPYRPKV